MDEKWKAGKEEGITGEVEIGKAEGMEIGMELGEKKGRKAEREKAEREKREMVRKMKSDDIALSMIEKYTGLSASEIEKL